MTAYTTRNWDAEADGAPADFSVAGGFAFTVTVASSQSRTAISGTKLFGRSSDGDISVYNTAGAIGDQAVRHAQRDINLAATTSLKCCGIVLRQALSGGNGYRVILEGNVGGTAIIIKIAKFEGGTTVLATSGDTVAPSASDIVHLEASATGTSTTTIDVRIWLNSDARPDSPTLTVNNSVSAYQTGYPGVRKLGTSYWNGVDNLVITDAAGGEDYFYPPLLPHDLTGAATDQSAVSGTGEVEIVVPGDLLGSDTTQSNTSNTGAITTTQVLVAATTTQANTSSTGAVSSIPRITTLPLGNNTRTLFASQTGVTVHVDNLDGTLLVTKTGQTTNSSAVMVMTDELFVPGTTYRCVFIFGSGAEGMARLAAT